MNKVSASFRDPDGYIFEFNSEIYRTVCLTYKEDYDHFQSSGLCKKLIDLGLIIPFVEVDSLQFDLTGVYKILKPERIKFISYPHEWSFSMLKDAALLTLEIQKLSLKYGMSLKDASAFNIQFQNGKPIFIDTLSFELYPKNRPWVAYGQFCQHFLAPLALMAHLDLGLNRLFITYLEGIPLELTTKILPFKSRFRIGLYLHIYLHAKAKKKHESGSTRLVDNIKAFSLDSMKTLVEGLTLTIRNQHWKPAMTEWSDYTNPDVHTKEYIDFKSILISDLLDETKPATIWDIGANIGYYSRIASSKGIRVISFDGDPFCVEKNYSTVKKNKETQILPLLVDFRNPSPSIGWRGNERISLFDRGKPDLILALAIIHHLAISSNIPLESIAAHFAEITDRLIIEFVPKEDHKVQVLLLNREDVFPNYNQCRFEEAFSGFFHIEKRIPCNYNQRIFYLMKLRLNEKTI